MGRKDFVKSLQGEEELQRLGAIIAKVTPLGSVIFLYGTLGAGKTTFSRGFLKGLGFRGRVKSPTYTLVESYELEDKVINHFDFYRIVDPHELDFLGIQDYFLPNMICLVEWPERGKTLLPPADLSCYIEVNSRGREIKIIADSPLGKDILMRLEDEN